MRWIHLSDIHFNPKGDNADTEQLREELLIYLAKNIGPVQRIFFTGDFRFARNQENAIEAAKEAATFLRKAGKNVGVRPASIFVVPGNHDLVRDEFRQVIVNGIKSSYCSGEHDIDKKSMGSLLQAFSPFHFFLCELYGKLKGDLCWEQRQTEPHYFVENKNYDLLLLNTALLCNRDLEDGLPKADNLSGNKEAPSLLLGAKWVLTQLRKSNAKEEDKLFIVLGHHGIRCMEQKEEKKITTYMGKYGVTLYLCGHNHEIGYTNVDGIHHVTMGCIKLESGVQASFSVGELNEETGDITVQTHSWSNNNWAQDLHWIKGGTLYTKKKA